LTTKKQKDDFATEVRRMEYTYTKIKDRLRASTTKLSPLTVWKNESLVYPNMCLLVKALYVLPYSSVPVERVFSNMKDIKNTKRNRLTLDNMEAYLLGHQASKLGSFDINEEMIDVYMKREKVIKNKIIKSEDVLTQSSQKKGEEIEKSSDYEGQIVDQNRVIEETRDTRKV